MAQNLIGITLISFGFFIAWFTIKNYKKSDKYSTVRTFCAALIIALIGLLVLFDLW